MVWVGIDVSKSWLDVEVGGGGAVEVARFDNDAPAHRKLCRWLRKHGGDTVRVVIEATGSYSVDLALALNRAKGIEVMVANPRAVKNFREALMQRASTDLSSATALREFAQRMEFKRWTPPSKATLELRAVTRRIEALKEMIVEEKNRCEASAASEAFPAIIRRDVEKHVRHLEKCALALHQEALQIVARESDLKERFEQLCSVKGIGPISALVLVAELGCMPTGLDVRQWVAYAGLDPRPIQSGSSVLCTARISKRGNVHLRRVLYMPATVAKRFNPHVRAFAEHLRARGKPEQVINVAIMRKLLHATYGMWRTKQSFDGAKFYAMENSIAA